MIAEKSHPDKTKPAVHWQWYPLLHTTTTFGRSYHFKKNADYSKVRLDITDKD